jgi:adenylate kinase
VADYYSRFDKVVKVPGEGSIDEIFSNLCSEIEARLS